MHAPIQKARHSAEVEIGLILNGERLAVAQLGPDFLIFSAPQNLDPSAAEVVLRVDGDEDRWKVWLPSGATVDEAKVIIVNL